MAGTVAPAALRALGLAAFFPVVARRLGFAAPVGGVVTAVPFVQWVV